MKSPFDRTSSLAQRHSRAFTLVEVMVSTALVVLIMAMLLSTVDGTQRVWSRGRAKISQFQSARNAFESMTRQLSQATLNAYYDVEYKKTTGETGLTTVDPVDFFRQSELHFVSGKSAQTKLLGTDAAVYPTHCMFFQTPVGQSSAYSRQRGDSVSASTARDLTSSLTAIGYFIKWGEEENLPQFIKDIPSRPKQRRFRLYQVQTPTEGLGLFVNFYEVSTPPAFLTKTTGWIQLAVDPAIQRQNSEFYNTPPRMLAQNIVALVILPKMPVKERPSPEVLDLAPDYEYDSRPSKADGTAIPKDQITLGGSATMRRQFNQLPPMVQITMVAIDDVSAAKMQDSYGEVPPPLTDRLFDRISTEKNFDDDLGLAADAANGDSLVRRLLQGIDASHKWTLNYRVYTTDVVLRGAKWSRDESGGF